MSRRNAPLQSQLEALAQRVLKSFKAGRPSIEIILLRGRELDRLKARFGLKIKGKRPDVLAFPEPKNFPRPDRKGKKALGEIYLNKELPPERIRFLLVHGILHLLGYTHDKKRDTLKMERMERKLMKLAQ